ncbi:schlafen family member 9-like [Phyllobates terribilis]|uniref:schlafen family member 9-like n=1 Tax=Phyllobates terribilis TaxID=111132 RepID=UPI003CCA7EA9
MGAELGGIPSQNTWLEYYSKKDAGGSNQGDSNATVLAQDKLVSFVENDFLEDLEEVLCTVAGNDGLRPSTLKVQNFALSAFMDYPVAGHPWIERLIKGTTRQIEEIQAFSIKDPYLRILEECIILRLNPTFLPKVVTTFHMSLQIVLPSFCQDHKNSQGLTFHSLDVRRIVLHDHYLNQNSKYPDRLLNVGKAVLGEHKRKKMNKEKSTQERENISRAVCALLNSGGGIVLIEISNEEFIYTKDGLGQDLENILRELVYKFDVSEFCDFSQEESNLIIFVKTWNTQRDYPKLCTLDTGLYARNLTSKEMLNASQVMNLIEKKKRGKAKRARFSSVTSDWQHGVQSLMAKEFLCLGEELELGESDHVEFKDFRSDGFQRRFKDVIRIYFSAFGNRDGGCLIIGVDDNKVVHGCSRGTKKLDLELFIKNYLEGIIFVHLGDCKSEEEFYTLTIKDVWDQSNHNGYVIFLEVEPLCCLGFVKHPQSWILDSIDGCLGKPLQSKQLTASEWIEKMTSSDSDPSLELQFESLSINEKPPLAKPVYNKKGLETLPKLKKSLFGSIADGITIIPDKLYEDLQAEYPGLEDLLNTVLPNSSAVLIVSRSWAADLEQKINPKVVCDILLLSPNKHPTLYSVFSAEVSEEEFQYSLGTAFALKKKLINVGSYTGKFCVIPKFLCLDAEHGRSSPSWPEIKYPETYKLDDLDTLEELFDSLTIVILSFRGVLSDKLGIEYFSLLTIEQYKILSGNLFNKTSFVHGPPGTGKTVIALEIIKKIKNLYNCPPDDILYICENIPLAEFVRSQGICQTRTRMWFVTKDMVNVQHIVVDEAQNFHINEGDWFKKAEDIVKNSGGVFWVFLDNFQSCHEKSTGLPECRSQNKYMLTKVVRSPYLIYEKILPKMNKFACRAKDPFLNDLIKKSDCCHAIGGFCEIWTLVKADIVKYVSENCHEYLSNGYSQSDIAILCSTDSTATEYKELLYKEINSCARKGRVLVTPFRRAEDRTQDAIIVDSVRRFSGLECLIVFAINPVSKNYRVNNNLFVCAASRATGNLHMLYVNRKRF